MRCLGLPNTKHFHDITGIEDAVALFAKLQEGLEGDAFDPAVAEEYEDSDGHVLNRKTYEDLARQGLL
jgi:splicing factor 3A subunit 3